MDFKRIFAMIVTSLALLLLLASCGGGSSKDETSTDIVADVLLTETDLFTRMIGFYQTETESYTNGELTYSGSRCDYFLEMYNIWTYFFSDMDDDTVRPGFLDSSLVYTSNSVRYEMSWEDSPGVVCTEFEEYVFGSQGATFAYETERDCDGATWRQVVTGTRIGAVDTPNDVIGEAIPITFDTPVSVALDEGDLDFFTFTLDETTSVETLFQNFTGTLTGLSYNLYYGERWMPSGGSGGGSPPSADRSFQFPDLEANTYYLVLAPHGCGESGTFDLTLVAP